MSHQLLGLDAGVEERLDRRDEVPQRDPVHRRRHLGGDAPQRSDRTRSGSGRRPGARAAPCAAPGCGSRPSGPPANRRIRGLGRCGCGRDRTAARATASSWEPTVMVRSRSRKYSRQEWDAVGVERPVGIEAADARSVVHLVAVPLGDLVFGDRRRRSRRRSSPPGLPVASQRISPSQPRQLGHRGGRELAVDLEVEAGGAATPRTDLTGADDDDHVVEVDRRGSGRDSPGHSSGDGVQHQRRRQGRDRRGPRTVVRRAEASGCAAAARRAERTCSVSSSRSGSSFPRMSSPARPPSKLTLDRRLFGEIPDLGAGTVPSAASPSRPRRRSGVPAAPR